MQFYWHLIFLASKLGVPTLNTIWSFLNARDFKEMAKIVTNQNDLNFDSKKNLAEIYKNF
jgi:hypothetical protein